MPADYEKLRVWQDTRVWVGTVYDLTEQFPASEAYNLTSQLRRSSVSVAANRQSQIARAEG